MPIMSGDSRLSNRPTSRPHANEWPVLQATKRGGRAIASSPEPLRPSTHVCWSVCWYCSCSPRPPIGMGSHPVVACHFRDRTDRRTADWLAALPADDGREPWRERGQCALGLLSLGLGRSYRNRTNWGRRGLPIIEWATTHHGTKPGATTRCRCTEVG